MCLHNKSNTLLETDTTVAVYVARPMAGGPGVTSCEQGKVSWLPGIGCSNSQSHPLSPIRYQSLLIICGAAEG